MGVPPDLEKMIADLEQMSKPAPARTPLLCKMGFHKPMGTVMLMGDGTGFDLCGRCKKEIKKKGKWKTK